MFEKISVLIDSMNTNVLYMEGVKIEKRQEYTIEYIKDILAKYEAVTHLDKTAFVSGIGHRKNIYQKQYQEMETYLNRLKTYAHHIEIYGETRNSYSKTDHDAIFIRVKRDYMGND